MKIQGILSRAAILLLGVAVLQAEERVKVDPINAVAVHLGSRAPLQITLHVQPGFHINSSQPLTPELIPTQIHFTPPEDLAIAKVQYPAGTLMSFPFDPTNKLSVYSGDVTVKAVVLPTPKASTGTFTVHAEVKYQACDNTSCYPPKRLPIAFDVKVTNAASGVPKARPTRTSPHIHN
jgi:hypothetical protein